jgi:hypothetical protein
MTRLARRTVDEKYLAVIALAAALPISAVMCGSPANAAPPTNVQEIGKPSPDCEALRTGRPLAHLPSDPEAFGRACGVPTQAQLDKMQAGITKQQIEWSHLMQVRQRIEAMKRALAGR